jgi:hypothetical protein
MGKPAGGRRGFGWRSKGEPDPEQARLLLAAAHDVLAGASLSDVARRWSALGAKRPQSRHDWTPDAVRQVLTSPRNAGLVGHHPIDPDGDGQSRVHKPVIVGPGNWPAIIPVDVYEQLCAVIESRGANSSVPRRRTLLTGVVTCAVCHHPMTRSSKPHGAIWRCISHDGGCGKVSIGAEKLEALLVEATLKRADNSRALGRLLAGMEGAQRSAAKIVGEIRKLDQRGDELATELAKGKMPAVAYTKATAALLRERVTLEGKLGHMNGSGAVARYATRPGLLRESWPSLSTDQRREMIKLFLGRITVAPAKKVGRGAWDPNRVAWTG